MFQLTGEETGNLRYQIGTSSRGGGLYLPQAFAGLVLKLCVNWCGGGSL